MLLLLTLLLLLLLLTGKLSWGGGFGAKFGFPWLIFGGALKGKVGWFLLLLLLLLNKDDLLGIASVTLLLLLFDDVDVNCEWCCGLIRLQDVIQITST